MSKDCFYLDEVINEVELAVMPMVNNNGNKMVIKNNLEDRRFILISKNSPNSGSPHEQRC